MAKDVKSEVNLTAVEEEAPTAVPTDDKSIRDDKQGSGQLKPALAVITQITHELLAKQDDRYGRRYKPDPVKSLRDQFPGELGVRHSERVRAFTKGLRALCATLTPRLQNRRLLRSRSKFAKPKVPCLAKVLAALLPQGAPSQSADPNLVPEGAS